MKNQFQLLTDKCTEEEGNRSLETWTDLLVEKTQETAIKIAGKKPKTRENKISESTIKLMEKRRNMKAEGIGIQNVEYVETCKTVRKKLREDIRSYNTTMIKSTIEENRSLKKTYKKLAHGKQKITSLLDRNGQEITDQDQILQRIEEFYEQLYNSNKETEDPGEPQEEIPVVTDWEVQHAINQMKRGKSPGPDNILIDTIKEGGDTITEELAKLYNACMQTRRIPHQWKEATMIILHKKGDKRDLKNYRPISLLSNLYKLYTKIITNRLEKILDNNQPREQAGFRRGFSTMDHIHTINQLKEKCQEFNIPLCVAFVDYEKAFDSVETYAVLKALQDQGINNAYIKILKDIYSDCYNTVRMHKASNKIMIRKGVRQGDTGSPKFFTACLESIFKTFDWSSKGININGENMSHLRFADDIVIISHNLNDLEIMLQELDDASRLTGLKMNMKKTKVMAGSAKDPKQIQVNGTKMEQVEDYIYLGQRFSLQDKNQDNEIRRRIKAGWQAFGRYSTIMKGKLPLCLKKKVYNQCIIPAISYAAETWTLTSKMERKLAASQHNMERSILSITYKDRKTNKWIREQTKVQDILETVKRRKWNWAGHISRRKDNRWSSAITHWTPYEGKRNRGRQRKRWRDELQQFWGQTNWHQQALNRGIWKHHAEAFILQWIDNG